MINKIRSIIEGPDYDFLRSNEHLGRQIVFLALGGSHAYGTSIEGSDIDIRGCSLNSKSDLLGMSSHEQVIDNYTDTTIYSFKKLVNLLINCNPSALEMLGCKPEHYLHMTPIARELMANKKSFLSKRVSHSFGGFASQQLRRLENALARDTYSQDQKERHIMDSCNSVVLNFNNKYTAFPEGSIRLAIDKSGNDNLEYEIFADVNLRHYPLRDYKNLWSDMNTVVKGYDGKLEHKKDTAHLNKHAMHVVRLYSMCLDILEKEEIITFREKEHDLLMSIRGGAYQKADGSFRPEFFEMVCDYQRRVDYAKENTSLPDNPDIKKVNDFVVSVNERVINGEY